MPELPQLSWISRLLGVGPRFQGTLIQLLDLGYKCRIRLPLFISAGFVLCHIFSVYLPTVEINVEVIEDNRAEEEEEDEEEYSIDSGEEEDSEADLAVVVEIVGDRQRGEGAPPP
jgi:hypothetical protein